MCIFSISVAASVNVRIVDPIKETSRDIAIQDIFTRFPINRSLWFLIPLHPCLPVSCLLNTGCLLLKCVITFKRWHWRRQTAALYRNKRCETLSCTSILVASTISLRHHYAEFYYYLPAHCIFRNIYIYYTIKRSSLKYILYIRYLFQI